MLPPQSPPRVQRAIAAMGGVRQFMMKYRGWVAATSGDVCDFAMGSPHEAPLSGFVAALQKAAMPQNKAWYDYTVNLPSATETVAHALQQQFKRPYTVDDIILTNGATGAIDVVLHSLLDFGDEVIVNSPPWFFYEPMVENTGSVPIRVQHDAHTFDLDLAAIEAAITPKTRLIFVNSPNNPTGKIYPPETLTQLGEILTTASAKNGRTIYLLSDEAYRDILFDGNAFHSPTSYYPDSVMIYTYAKRLLTPGQRLGYIGISPEMSERSAMRAVFFATQRISGLATANALLQHALPDIHALSIDMAQMQAKRDRMLSGLRASGYEVHSPEGTFYLMPQSPIADDVAFAEALAAEGVFCMPGQTVEMPGYIRLSLTANDDMIERALPIFAAVRERVLKGVEG